MNKIERMTALFNGMETDHVPAGFWFHYPVAYTVEQNVNAHVALFRDIDADIIKIMDDNFGQMVTQEIKIDKPSDWRGIRLPGRDCLQYRRMEEQIRGIVEKIGNEAMVFATMWSPFKIASFTYLASGSTDAAFMAHCKEDPASVLEGIKVIADTLEQWAHGYLAAGANGLYYAGQFSEPARFSTEEWEMLVKPSDLQILHVADSMAAKYNIVHICGEVEHGFQSGPERYQGYPGDLFNWDVHRTGLSLEAGKQLFGKPILGGLDNHGLLIEGSPAQVAEETRRVIEKLGKKGLMIGADCTIPPTISLDNLRAAVQAAKLFSGE